MKNIKNINNNNLNNLIKVRLENIKSTQPATIKININKFLELIYYV